MPIDNRLFGVWKTFSYDDIVYVVEQASEGVSQEITPKNYIMGTAMPRVMEIKGAEASLDITAPILVTSAPSGSAPGTMVGRTANPLTDTVNDGLTLIKYLQGGGSTNYMDGGLSRDPFFIFKTINFSVSADQGATYKITAVGDYDALKSENSSATAGFGLTGPTTIAVPGGTNGNPAGLVFPTLTNYVYRVASFYDFDVSVGGQLVVDNVNSFLQELTVDISYTIQDFSWVGQPDQRKYYGIAEMSAKVSGTIISTYRSPTGHGMPLQAEKGTITLPTPLPVGDVLHTGGYAWPTDGTFYVYLRGSLGPLDVLPQLSANPQRFVFSSSTLQATTGLLTTKFEGQLWAQTNS